ncbi:MAG: folate family ECF transporter S component [Streptococcaceae bacterium]|nr:folate family ECF transporter S component [Streptococcaceae bacterium]
MKKLFNVRVIALMGIFIALDVLLTGVFAINTPLMRITFNYLPRTFLGVLFGPFGAFVATFTSGITNDLLFPNNPFFIGFPLSAGVVGLLFGYFFYQKEVTLKRIILATIVISILQSLVFTPLNLYLLYQTPYASIFIPRVIRLLITIPIQICLTYWIVPKVLCVHGVQRFVSNYKIY